MEEKSSQGMDLLGHVDQVLFIKRPLPPTLFTYRLLNLNRRPNTVACHIRIHGTEANLLNVPLVDPAFGIASRRII